MKALIAAALIAIGAIVVLSPNTDASSDSEHQLQNVDSYLEEGLSEETHQHIADGAEAGRRWFAEFSERVSEAAE